MTRNREEVPKQGEVPLPLHDELYRLREQFAQQAEKAQAHANDLSRQVEILRAEARSYTVAADGVGKALTTYHELLPDQLAETDPELGMEYEPRDSPEVAARGLAARYP